MGGGGVDQAGAQVVAEAEVGAHGVGLALALLVAALALLGGGVAQVGRVEAGAGEVGRVGRRRVVGLVGEGLADGVEHEHGVDDPDAGGEVGAALVDVGVAAGAGAVAQGGVDAQRRVGGLGAWRCERVELGVELVGRAAEDAGRLVGGPAGVRCVAGERDLGVGVQQGAVVDADGVRVLVLDDGAVHEGAEVAQGGVVQVAGRDPLGDGLGELGRDVVHVGEPVGQRDRELALGRAVRRRGRGSARAA